MASLNKVFLIGNLTRDPELRYTASGIAVADLNLAVSQKFVTKAGEKKEDVVFVRITVWSKQAEACGEYLFKGSSVFIEGRLLLDTWESKEGERRSRLRVIAQRVQFMGRPRGAQTQTAPVGQSGTEDQVEELAPDTAGEAPGNEEEAPF